MNGIDLHDVTGVKVITRELSTCWVKDIVVTTKGKDFSVALYSVKKGNLVLKKEKKQEAT